MMDVSEKCQFGGLYLVLSENCITGEEVVFHDGVVVVL